MLPLVLYSRLPLLSVLSAIIHRLWPLVLYSFSSYSMYCWRSSLPSVDSCFEWRMPFLFVLSAIIPVGGLLFCRAAAFPHWCVGYYLPPVVSFSVWPLPFLFVLSAFIPPLWYIVLYGICRSSLLCRRSPLYNIVLCGVWLPALYYRLSFLDYGLVFRISSAVPLSTVDSHPPPVASCSV